MKEILIIDDDKDLSFIISEMLESYGFSVTTAESGEEAFSLLSNHTYHLILLDINLPDITGLEFCRELRKVSQVPVIFASARTSENDRIVGFDIGGDDYLPKPFEINELLARITVQLRRKNTDTDMLVFRDLTLHTDLLTAVIGETEIRLTRTECAILKLLMQNTDHPVGKTSILEKISCDTPDCTERSLKQHVSNIRHKLQAVSGKDYIEAVYGIGFRMKS